MKVALVFLMVLPSLLCETVFLNDLAPEEAQARLASQSLDLQYAKFLGQRALPLDQATYSEGRIASNPEDYLQNSYQANQFHGQDGLGRAMFGYSDWNQGRLEARNANGEVRGSYQYVDAFGENVIVNYWADSLGFHQTDNRRQSPVDTVTETPEVLAARLAHQRAWDAAAKAAQQSPDPMSDVYNANANRLDEEQSEYEQAQQILAQQQIPNQYQNIKTVGRNDDIVDSDGDSVLVQAGAESRRNAQYQRVRIEDSQGAATETEFREQRDEVTGPPHGFFYSVDYPVQVVVEHPESIARRLIAGPQPQLLQQQLQPELQSQQSLLRRPTIVAPQPIRNVNEEDSSEFKILPIRILDTKKFKRSEQSPRRRQAAANRNRYQRHNLPVPAEEPVHKSIVTPPSATKSAVASPVAVAAPAASSSEIILIKSLAEQQHEQELRRLVSNADAVDGVHDAQIHPKQAARAAVAKAAARKYRSFF